MAAHIDIYEKKAFGQGGFQNDEITIVDLWRAITKYRAVIAATIVICLLAATGYLFFTKPIYRSTAALKVGIAPSFAQLQNAENITKTWEYLEPANLLVKRLTEKYQINNGDMREQQILRLESVPHGKDGSDEIVTVAASAMSPHGAKDYLAKVVDELIQEHDHHRLLVVKAYEDILASYQKRKAELDSHANLLDFQIQNLKKIDPTQSALLVLEKGRVITESIKLEEKSNKLKIQLSPINNAPTKLISPPSLPAEPFRPKYSLIIVSSIFTGIIAGLLLVFVLEFLSSIQQKSQIPQT